MIKRRRAVGAERAQFTWVVFAFVLLTTTVVLTFLYIFISIGVGAGDPGDDAWGPAYLMMILFPLSFGVAVLRYRLYEIDRIVSRTVSYALVVGLLAGAFLGVVALMSSLLPRSRRIWPWPARHWWWLPCSTLCEGGSRLGWTAASIASDMTLSG